MMKLRELLNGLDILETNAELDSDIREVRYDSRLVESGDLFIAVTGAETDGRAPPACCASARRRTARPSSGWRTVAGRWRWWAAIASITPHGR